MVTRPIPETLVQDILLANVVLVTFTFLYLDIQYYAMFWHQQLRAVHRKTGLASSVMKCTYAITIMPFLGASPMGLFVIYWRL